MKTRKIIFVLLIISLLLSTFFVSQSFAKYLSSANEEATMSIARWKILVNNKDIRDKSTINTIITPVFPGNDNIAGNIIAPTSEGYFDLIIDARQADVSFKYTINISVNEDSPVKDLIATKYTINDSNEINLTNGNQTIENTILHKDNTNLINIRIYIKWNDDDTATMNNEEDTNATTSASPAKMNVSINFTQVV